MLWGIMLWVFLYSEKVMTLLFGVNQDADRVCLAKAINFLQIGD
jgi:hypothetical protein